MIDKSKKINFCKNALVVIDWANVYGWSKSLGWQVDPQRLFNYLSTHSEVISKKLYQGTETGDKRSEDFVESVKSIGFDLITKEVKFTPVSLEKSHFKKIVKELFDVLDKTKITNTNIANKLFEIKQKIEVRLADKEPDFDMGDDGEMFVAGELPAYAKEDGAIYTEAYDLIDELDTELKKLNLSIDELQKHLSEPIKRRKCDFDVEITRDVYNSLKDFDQLVLFSGDGDYSALVEDLLNKGKRVIVIFAYGHIGKEYENLKGKKGLFMCPVSKLKDDISAQNNIPPDFSGGRDTSNISEKD